MATICNTCLHTTTNPTAGMCPTCHQANERTRRPTGWNRYPASYRRARATILATNPPCHWCGQPATTIDHLTPRADGGTHDPSNLAPACARCNTTRGNRW